MTIELQDYEAGPALLRAAVAGLTAEELRLPAVEGTWSTLDVLCHLGDTEQFFADRMKRTAIHTETGLVTLRQLLRDAIDHFREHLAFIQKGWPRPAAVGDPHEVARQGVFLISTDPSLLDVA